MTIEQTIKYAAAKFKKRKLKFPHLEAEILLSAVLRKPREYLLAHSEKRLTGKQAADFQSLAIKKLKGWPTAYLTGHQEFYGLDFHVDKNVLIPRPETELMVEEALRIRHSTKQITVIDAGTGSGCIIITLAKLLHNESPNKNYEFYGIDLSDKALVVARQNAKQYGLAKKIKFIKGNLLSPVVRNSSLIIDHSLIILANLPYGWPAWKNSSDPDIIGLKYEPPIALFAGPDGLKLYEKFFRQIKKLLAADRRMRNMAVLCEFDPRQTAPIKKLIKKYLPEGQLQIKKDLAGLNRLAVIAFKF